jgi:hypothetical protein
VCDSFVGAEKREVHLPAEEVNSIGVNFLNLGWPNYDRNLSGVKWEKRLSSIKSLFFDSFLLSFYFLVLDPLRIRRPEQFPLPRLLRGYPASCILSEVTSATVILF